MAGYPKGGYDIGDKHYRGANGASKDYKMDAQVIINCIKANPNSDRYELDRLLREEYNRIQSMKMKYSKESFEIDKDIVINDVEHAAMYIGRSLKAFKKLYGCCRSLEEVNKKFREDTAELEGSIGLIGNDKVIFKCNECKRMVVGTKDTFYNFKHSNITCIQNEVELNNAKYRLKGDLNESGESIQKTLTDKHQLANTSILKLKRSGYTLKDILDVEEQQASMFGLQANSVLEASRTFNVPIKILRSDVYTNKKTLTDAIVKNVGSRFIKDLGYKKEWSSILKTDDTHEIYNIINDTLYFEFKNTQVWGGRI